MKLSNGPIIKREFGKIIRNARGYSIDELQTVGINSHIARKNNIPVDRLRRSKHNENVERLKPIAEAIKKSRASKPKTSTTAPEKVKSKKKSKSK